MALVDKEYDLEIDDETKYRREINSGERTLVFYFQLAYLNIDKRNDVEFNIPLSETQLPFRAGRYNFLRRNALLSVNQYGSLEINREISYASVAFPIVPVVSLAEKKAA